MLYVPKPLDLAAIGCRRIDLSERHGLWCLVDADDYDWLIANRWNSGWWANTPHKRYAKRNVGKERSTVYLHREVMTRHESARRGVPLDPSGRPHQRPAAR